MKLRCLPTDGDVARHVNACASELVRKRSTHAFITRSAAPLRQIPIHGRAGDPHHPLRCRWRRCPFSRRHALGIPLISGAAWSSSRVAKFAGRHGTAVIFRISNVTIPTSIIVSRSSWAKRPALSFGALPVSRHVLGRVRLGQSQWSAPYPHDGAKQPRRPGTDTALPCSPRGTWRCPWQCDRRPSSALR
jgi:hypothetical protein